jgi:hypothetical protein
MNARKPIVRHFIACEKVDSSAGARQYSLQNIIHSIRTLPGATFPQVHPELFLFVMMTDGRGAHEFGVELVYWDRGTQRSTWASQRVKLDLGRDPLTVHGWPIRLRNLPFVQPGDYDFVLWCDGEVLARETIHVR